jgi:hypothetical protein
VGENFVVPTHEGNNEGVEFYNLKCQKKAILSKRDSHLLGALNLMLEIM